MIISLRRMIILFSIISVVSISLIERMMIIMLIEKRESSEERIESISLRAEGLPFPKRDKRLSYREEK